MTITDKYDIIWLLVRKLTAIFFNMKKGEGRILMRKQAEYVLDYLKKHGTITATEAYKQEIPRLSAVIYDIRAEGIKIYTEYEFRKGRFGKIKETRYALDKKELEKYRDEHIKKFLASLSKKNREKVQKRLDKGEDLMDIIRSLGKKKKKKSGEPKKVKAKGTVKKTDAKKPKKVQEEEIVLSRKEEESYEDLLKKVLF